MSHLFHCREIDCIKAKGKQQSVTIYTILKKADTELSRPERAFLKCYADGLALYRERDFKKATNIFTKGLTINPNDKPTQILLARCKDFELNPPQDFWCGAWKFAQK